MSCKGRNCNRDCRCNNVCDPCKKQPKLYYCGADIACVDVKKSEDIHSALKKIGDKLCQIVEQESPLTYVNIIDATEEQCIAGGYVLQILQVGTDNLISEHILCNGDASDIELVIETTVTEVNELIINSELIPGVVYKIADRGIFLKALANNFLASTGERVMRCVKNTYYTVDSGSGILGVWNTNITPNTDDIAVWGGKVWRNLTGVVGTATDDTALDATNWVLVTTTDNTYYFTKSFGCVYDFTHDWVSEQWDERGNYFTYDWFTEQNFYSFGYNLIDISDWGNESIYLNRCFGIFNNSNNESISNNSNTGYISNNSNNGDIFNNSNNESISNNSNNGAISYNSNNESISNNSNTGSISNNSNVGYISNNSNTGDILNNSNVGYISGIGSANNGITYNTNNGNIITTTTGDITDAVVNK